MVCVRVEEAGRGRGVYVHFIGELGVFLPILCGCNGFLDRKSFSVSVWNG